MTTLSVNRTALAVLTVAVLALGAGCGGGSSGKDSTGSGSSSPASGGGGSTDSTGAIDPCAIVSTDSISSIVGETATQDGKATDANRGRVCSWKISDGAVDIATFKGQQFYADGILGPSVPGIGDAAQATATGGTVLFRKGDDVVSVQVLGGDQSRDQAISLAKACSDAI